MEHDALKEFKKIGFWNMDCVRISEVNQSKKLKGETNGKGKRKTRIPEDERED